MVYYFIYSFYRTKIKIKIIFDVILIILFSNLTVRHQLQLDKFFFSKRNFKREL